MNQLNTCSAGTFYYHCLCSILRRSYAILYAKYALPGAQSACIPDVKCAISLFLQDFL